MNQPPSYPDMQRWQYLVSEQRRLLEELAAPDTDPCSVNFSDAYYLLKEAVTAAMLSLFPKSTSPSDQGS